MIPFDKPGRLSLPARTTPTWEVELLIAAALVVGLFQALGPLELSFAKWIMLAPGEYAPLVVYGHLYLKSALFVLIATFVLHIAARAAWVALVGVHSIYPGGPKWENLSGGPINRSVSRVLAGDVEQAIDRADNRASLVFAYGILAAQFALMTLVVTLAVIALSRVLALLMPGPVAFLTAFSVLLVPLLLFSVIDKLFGARLKSDGFAARALARGLRIGQTITLARYTSPLLPLVTTNVGGRRGTWLLIGVIYLALAATGLDTVARTGKLTLLRGDAMPEPSRSRGVHPLHYASLRDERQRFSSAPYIPTEVVEGPYLRLFVPYSPDQHDRLIEQRCDAEAQALTAADGKDSDEAPEDSDQEALLLRDRMAYEAEAAYMACFAELLQVRLDGEPIDGLTLERQRDPFSGHDGGLAMIDVRGLAPGRHELQIDRLPAASNNGLNLKPRPPSPPDRIVFWR